MASSETKAAEGGDPIADVLEDSVAYSLVDDAWRMLKINDLEAKYFKKKYREMYEVLHGIETQEKVIIREKETVESEILAEKIEMEKTVVDENDASRTLRKLEEQRAELQEELEFTEQKDTMVKFELEELKRVHEELTEAHKQMNRKTSTLWSQCLRPCARKTTA